MKKILLLLLLVSFFGLQKVQGQFIDAFGVKTGLCLAERSIRFTPIDAELPTDVLVGPGLILFAEVFKGKHLSLQLDAGVLFKGYKTTAHSLTVDHSNNDQIVVNHGPLITEAHQYFTLSPLGKFERLYGKVSIYALLGPRMDVKLNSSSDSPYPLEVENDLLLGLTGGFGIGYSLEKFGLFLETQYQPDLSPVNNTEPLLVNNNVLFVSGGITF